MPVLRLRICCLPHQYLFPFAIPPAGDEGKGSQRLSVHLRLGPAKTSWEEGKSGSVQGSGSSGGGGGASGGGGGGGGGGGSGGGRHKRRDKSKGRQSGGGGASNRVKLRR